MHESRLEENIQKCGTADKKIYSYPFKERNLTKSQYNAWKYDGLDIQVIKYRYWMHQEKGVGKHMLEWRYAEKKYFCALDVHNSKAKCDYSTNSFHLA